MKDTLRNVGTAAATLGEGVIWSAGEQCFYWVDILQQRLHRCGPDALNPVSWDMPSMISAAIPATGEQLLCFLSDGIYRFSPENQALEKLLDPEAEFPGNRFNDATIATDGRLWFGSMDNAESELTGQFFTMGAELEPRSLLGGICITNGPAVNRDASQVYFTDTVRRRVYRNRIDGALASLDDAAVFVELNAEEGFPDGMCCDAADNLWLCHWGSGLLSCYDATGKLLHRVQLPVSNVTKCAFGGAALDKLLITTATKGLSEAELAQQPLAGGLFQLDLAAFPQLRGFDIPLFELDTA